MAKAPAFQFYANDFMDATSTWEANACGLYIRCLCKQWTHGSIPADLRILARAIHSDREELEACWDVLGPKFIDQGDGTLKNRKLEEVRERQKEVSEKRSEAGKLGAIAKANANANGQAKPKQRKVKEKEKIEGEEGSLKVEAYAHEPEIIPAGLTVPMNDALNRWKEYRKERKPALTRMGIEALVRKAVGMGEARWLAAVEHSLANGWQGVFEPRTEQTRHNGTGQRTADERAAEYARILAERYPNG